MYKKIEKTISNTYCESKNCTWTLDKIKKIFTLLNKNKNRNLSATVLTQLVGESCVDKSDSKLIIAISHNKLLRGYVNLKLKNSKNKDIISLLKDAQSEFLTNMATDILELLTKHNRQ